jgi:hypothetical protein
LGELLIHWIRARIREVFSPGLEEIETEPHGIGVVFTLVQTQLAADAHNEVTRLDL